jgi:hypothetical protein
LKSWIRPWSGIAVFFHKTGRVVQAGMAMTSIVFYSSKVVTKHSKLYFSSFKCNNKLNSFSNVHKNKFLTFNIKR